jgi:hypothetical protein
MEMAMTYDEVAKEVLDEFQLTLLNYVGREKEEVASAWERSKHCKMVLLVKVDPSTEWWSIFWDYEEKLFCGVCGSSELLSGGESFGRCLKCDSGCSWEKCRRIRPGPKPGCEVRFLPKRVKFDPPKALGVKKKLSGPSFPSVILIFDRRGL